MSTPAELERLAQRSVDVRHASAEILDFASRHVLDWLGCAAQGASSPVGRVFAQWLQLQARGDRPTLAGIAAEGSAAAAYHGALGSTLEMDDVHRSAILHPGPVVIPAALGAASAQTSGACLLGAVLAGYEVMIRVGRALGPSHYRFWHNTSTAGSFGAAAAASAVLGLDASRTAQALALAGTRAGGLWQVRHEASTGKAWHMAGAARDGLAAAQLAACGLTGPLGVLEGPSGWFAATAPGAEPLALTEARTDPWMTDVSFKPWPACRHAHPAMDALRAALAKHPTSAEEVERIDVFTYGDALRFCDQPEPSSDHQARFSIQHALAAWMCWGESQRCHYESNARGDAVLCAVRQRIFLHVDPPIDARFPAHYGARVRLHRRDGTVQEGAVVDTWGDPARPMSHAALQAKARLLMKSADWCDSRIGSALTACHGLPGAPNLVALHAALSP